MTILLFGSGSFLTWSASILADIVPGDSPAMIEVADAERLAEVLRDPPTALVIVDPPPPAPNLGTAEGRSAEFIEALRGRAQRAVFALEVARRARRSLIFSEQFARPEDWIGALAQVADVSLAAPVAEILQRFPAPADGIPAAPFARDGEPALPEAWRQSLENYLDPLVAGAAAGTPESLVWRRELLLDGDAMGEQLPAIVEVAGRARILAFGPYLPLPTGPWSMTAYLGFSPDIGRMPFILEIDTGGAVTRGFFEVDRGGIFSVALDFQVVKPLHPVEIRLISQDSALEGQLALIELRLDSKTAPSAV